MTNTLAETHPWLHEVLIEEGFTTINYDGVGEWIKYTNKLDQSVKVAPYPHHAVIGATTNSPFIRADGRLPLEKSYVVVQRSADVEHFLSWVFDIE